MRARTATGVLVTAALLAFTAGCARDLDVLAVAPCTANGLAKFARGVADDFLSTLYVAVTGPVVMLPERNADAPRPKTTFLAQADAPSCSDCGAIMVRNGACYKCLNCGSTSGCS